MINYSKMEQKLLGLLRKRRGPITSEELAERLYQDMGKKPYHPRNAVVSTMSSLIRKTVTNKESFKILKSSRSGPYPTSYRIER